MTTSKEKVLIVEGLKTSFHSGNGEHVAVRGINFEINKAECLGVIGETGSGKTISFISLLGLLPKHEATVIAERIDYWKDGKAISLLESDRKLLAHLRGKEIGLVFQNPRLSLNPIKKCGIQINQILRRHLKLTKAQAKIRALTTFSEVGLSSPIQIYNSFPHQVSGGELQRVMIAMAISCNPLLLILDEPTASLDPLIQKEIMSLLMELKRNKSMAIAFISHDIALISQIADHIIHIDNGKIIESARKIDFFRKANHPKSRFILEQFTDFAQSQFQTSLSPDAAVIISIEDIVKNYESGSNWFSKSKIKVLDHLTLDIYSLEKLGIIGESGSGKTTLAKCMSKLNEIDSGTVKYFGKLNVCYLFQDAYTSIDPSLSVFSTIKEALLTNYKHLNQLELQNKIVNLLESVHLNPSIINRRSYQLSGGQRQRVNLARGLATNPDVLICDEITSGLDLIVQYQIIKLLKEIGKNKTIIFISHDISLVRYFCDRIIIMKSGKIIEVGHNPTIFNEPISDYTQKLIEAIPKITLSESQT